MNITHLKEAYVWRETLYTVIYALPSVSSTRGSPARRPLSGGVGRRGQIPEMVSTHVRSPEIEDRLIPGNWEGNLIKGKANASSLGTLVKRTSGYLMLVK